MSTYDMTIFESLLKLASIHTTPRPQSGPQCEKTYRDLASQVSYALDVTDKYGWDTKVGDRTLQSYRDKYQKICDCIASGYYPERSLVDNIEALAIRLEVIDLKER